MSYLTLLIICILSLILNLIFLAILIINKKIFGTITVSKNEDGVNVWAFKFDLNNQYEDISKMKTVKFRIVKGDNNEC